MKDRSSRPGLGTYSGRRHHLAAMPTDLPQHARHRAPSGHRNTSTARLVRAVQGTQRWSAPASPDYHTTCAIAAICGPPRPPSCSPRRLMQLPRISSWTDLVPLARCASEAAPWPCSSHSRQSAGSPAGDPRRFCILTGHCPGARPSGLGNCPDSHLPQTSSPCARRRRSRPVRRPPQPGHTRPRSAHLARIFVTFTRTVAAATQLLPPHSPAA